MSELRSYLDFAVDVAHRAGRATLAHFGVGGAVQRKADDTPVTAADHEAERIVRDAIASRWPGHGVLGEEFGEAGAGRPWRWVVDPIDGTKSFVRGLPFYGVLLGLERDGANVLGVAHFPALGETVAAARGEGCYLSGRRCHASDAARLADATVSCTDVASFAPAGKAEAWDRMAAATAYRVGLPDAYGHALVATGRLDVMLDPRMHPWDCGPFPTLLGEAGGYFGDWRGEVTLHGGEAVSCAGPLRDEVLRVLNAPAADGEPNA